jgi:membrane associated rhomboid family serine protease
MVFACVIVHVLDRLGGFALRDLGAVYGPAVLAGEWWRVFTAGFLHVDVVHLALNMFSLLMLGRGLEELMRRSGRWQFPLLYVASLLGGSLGAILLEYDVPAVGASGAIFGLLGAAVVIPQRWGLGWNGFGVAPWLMLNVFFTFASPGISRGGHLGGLFVGVLVGALLAPSLRNP